MENMCLSFLILLLSAGISSVMLPTHDQADMTKPAAALTWWVSACGGSINKHYLSSRTSNRAGPPGGTRGEVCTFYGCCV